MISVAPQDLNKPHRIQLKSAAQPRTNHQILYQLSDAAAQDLRAGAGCSGRGGLSADTSSVMMSLDRRVEIRNFREIRDEIAHNRGRVPSVSSTRAIERKVPPRHAALNDQP